MSDAKIATREVLKPIPVRVSRGLFGRAMFAVRQIADLQLYTIWRFLGPNFKNVNGSLIDVGCGEMPFRSLLPDAIGYHGIDVELASDFKMSGNSDIRTFDGRNIPFDDNSFDNALCTEVLEHAEDPETLVAEIFRVLKPGGVLLATIPFAARVHYAPHDYHRFTRHRLDQMFAVFADVSIEERGNDIATIANKLIVLCARLLKPSWRFPLNCILLLGLAPFAVAFLTAAHIAIWGNWGSLNDPLGYAIKAKR